MGQEIVHNKGWVFVVVIVVRKLLLHTFNTAEANRPQQDRTKRTSRALFIKEAEYSWHWSMNRHPLSVVLSFRQFRSSFYYQSEIEMLGYHGNLECFPHCHNNTWAQDGSDCKKLQPVDMYPRNRKQQEKLCLCNSNPVKRMEPLNAQRQRVCFCVKYQEVLKACNIWQNVIIK